MVLMLDVGSLFFSGVLAAKNSCIFGAQSKIILLISMYFVHSTLDCFAILHGEKDSPVYLLPKDFADLDKDILSPSNSHIKIIQLFYP